MIIKKITTGFVIQNFDTDTEEFVSQEFICGDQVDLEDELGDPIDDEKIPDDFWSHYLDYAMVQPFTGRNRNMTFSDLCNMNGFMGYYSKSDGDVITSAWNNDCPEADEIEYIGDSIWRYKTP